MSSVNSIPDGMLILVKFENVIYQSTDLGNFELINSINQRPSGQFTVIDRNSDLINQQSGDYGFIIFRSSDSDGNMQNGVVPFIIDQFNEVENASGNTKYLIQWTAGLPTLLSKKTRGFKGTSMEALLDTCEQHEATVVELLSDQEFEKPADAMTWRFIQDNIWEAFDDVMPNSYIKNDYLYWVYDETKNFFRVSTFEFEKAREDRHIFIYSNNALTTSDQVKQSIDDPSMTIWTYSDVVRINDLGKNREHLFPNISFSGIVSTDLKQAGFKKSCFSEVLSSMGDSKQSEVMNTTDLSDNTIVYGDLKIKRHYPNNGHKMYSIASTYRDYKLHTYGKVLYVKIYNTLGPELGSKCAVFVSGNQSKITGLSVDTMYTDNYILTDKYIKFSTELTDTTGRTKSSGTASFVTTLRFISDNIGSSGFEDMESIINQLGSLG